MYNKIKKLYKKYMYNCKLTVYICIHQKYLYKWVLYQVVKATDENLRKVRNRSSHPLVL